MICSYSKKFSRRRFAILVIKNPSESHSEEVESSLKNQSFIVYA